MREKEFQKTYYEQRIKAINMVLSIVGEINEAKSEESRLKASEKFWIIHFGYSVVYFNSELFHSLSSVTKYINKCIQKHKIESSINCDFPIALYLQGFSLSARKQLSKGWDIDFEKISENHPWHESNKI